MVDARIIVVVAVVVLMGGVILASGSLQTAGFTEGEDQGNHSWTGRLILTDTEYTTAWQSNADSEDITVQPWVKVGFSLHAFSLYQLIATVEGVEHSRFPATGWVSPQPSIIPGGTFIPLQSWTFNIQGEKVGRLKVQMRAVLRPTLPLPTLKVWEGDFGWDGAFLKSGRGEIFLYGNQGPFEEGSNAQVYVSTGFTNGAGWSVRLRPPITRPGLFPVKTVITLGDDKSQVVPIRIEEGWFVVGELVDNTFTVELWNHLFDIGFTQLMTIDDLARAPGQPAVSFDLERNTATITAVSVATFKNIDSFFVWAWYGSQTMPSISDSQSWIQNGVEYIPTAMGDNYSVTFTVNAKNFDGTVIIKVVASDTDGRASPPGFVSLKVVQGSFEPGPNIGQPFIWSLIVYILIAMGLIFGFIMAYYIWITTGSIGMTLFAFLILFGVFGIAAFVAGSVPSIATLLGLSIGGI